MAPKKAAAPKPTIKITHNYLGEDFEVEIIVPRWAMHKKNGGEPSDLFEEEGGESMWELYVQGQGEKESKKALEKKRLAIEAAEKLANDKRLQSLKKSFEIFDEDGSGELDEDEILGILTRMTGDGANLTQADAKAFIEEFDRDGNGLISIDEFIIAMGVMSDATDADGDGTADMKDGGGDFDGKEDEFAAKLAAGETINVAGIKAGEMKDAIEGARRLQM